MRSACFSLAIAATPAVGGYYARIAIQMQRKDVTPPMRQGMWMSWSGGHHADRGLQVDIEAQLG
jgi:hypothetical protein